MRELPARLFQEPRPNPHLQPEGRSASRQDKEEIMVVLRGVLRVDSEIGTLEVRAGQAVVTAPGEWGRCSTLLAEGAECVTVCLPAFSPSTAHQDR